MDTIWNFLWSASKDKPVWIDLLSLAITLYIAILGFRRAFGAWEKQKKREIELTFKQRRYESELEAHKTAWKLLAYLAEKESDKTVFVDRGDPNNKTFNLRVTQAKEYLTELPKIFYLEGNGLFMSREIEDDLYTFRSRIYQILEKANRKGDTNELIEITNPTIKEQLKEVRERLRKNIVSGIWASNIQFED